MKTFRIILGVLVALIFVTILYARIEARRMPIVHRTSVAMRDWPGGAAPITVALISDIHARSQESDLARLGRIVDQVNALHPDMILIAGDFLHGEAPGSADTMIKWLAPLARLHAPLGVIAVPGNHDHWTGLPALRTLLEWANITLLENSAIQRGPLVIGGVDDLATRRGRIVNTVVQMDQLTGAKLILTHYVDDIGDFPADIGLLVAGHTHCGQVWLPIAGPLTRLLGDTRRFRCGQSEEDGRTVIVSGGLGTTGPAIRLGAPPDLWLIRLGPTDGTANKSL